MFYQRVESLPIERRLTREELRVITACRNKVAIEEIVTKTKLEQDKIIKSYKTPLLLRV